MIAGTVSGAEQATHYGEELLVCRCRSGTRIWLRIRREMDQEPIWNQAVIECRPHLYLICSELQRICTSMYAERLAIIGALVHQQNMNLLRLHYTVYIRGRERLCCVGRLLSRNLSELLSNPPFQHRSQKRYAAQPTKKQQRRINARMRRTLLYINARVTLKQRWLPLAAVKPMLKQRRLRRCAAKQLPSFPFFPILNAVTSFVEIRPLSLRLQEP